MNVLRYKDNGNLIYVATGQQVFGLTITEDKFTARYISFSPVPSLIIQSTFLGALQGSQANRTIVLKQRYFFSPFFGVGSEIAKEGILL